MLLDDTATDRESETCSALFTRVEMVHLRESVEDCFKFIRWDAATLVAHAEDQLVGRLLAVEPDRAPDRRKLDCIGQQIDKHLEQAVRIAAQLRTDRHDLEDDAGLFSQRMHRVGCLGHQRVSIAKIVTNTIVARVQSFEVQGVIDQANEPIRVREGELEYALARLGLFS